jgi:co-chaperonin GroES (HSP10)
MRVINNNTLIKLEKQSTTLGNGLSVNNETQNRKDIVTGTVVQSTDPEIHGIAYFPMYAASIITTSEGEFYIINNADILALDDR